MDGVTIGQYRVTGLIGHGGMGAVYAAEHTLLGRPAAIKVLLPELSQKQDVVTRFFNEARAATAIRHPGIVEIYDFGWTPDGAAFIVMEHLEGETLATRSAREPLRWQVAFAIARQIAGALAAAHNKGIVHRDLKPENIFLVSDPEVPGGERIKLLDFGIAKLADETTTTMSVTKTGAVMGTPTYMAPEQCRGVVVDHRADIYALGCIMFELCAGRPPFVGEGTGDVLAAHIHVAVPRLATLGVELPAPVEAVIRHLLAKTPAQRLQTAEAVIQAIDAVTSSERAHPTGLSSGARAATASASASAMATEITTLSGAASTSPSLSSPAARRSRRLVAVVAAAALAGGATAAVLLWSRADPAPRAVVSSESSHGVAGAVAEPAGPDPSRAAPAPAETPPAPAAAPGSPSPAVPAPAPGSPAAGAAEPLAPVAPAPTVPAPAAPDPAAPAPDPSPPASPPAGPIDAPRTAGPPAFDVAIESVPAGAQVMLGGTVLGKTPFHGTLRRSNDATLVIRLAGYADRTVAVHAGQALSERVKLVKSSPRTPRQNRDQSVNPFGD